MLDEQEEVKRHQSVDAASAAAGRTAGPGALLRAQRERLGLDVNRVSATLHLRPEIVQALEDDRQDRLPPATFVRGYLRAYAELLKLPLPEVMAAYESLHPQPALQPLPTREVVAEGGSGKRAALLGVSILAVILLIAWWLNRPVSSLPEDAQPVQTTQQEPPPAVSSRPVSPAPAQESPAQPAAAPSASTAAKTPESAATASPMASQVRPAQAMPPAAASAPSSPSIASSAPASEPASPSTAAPAAGTTTTLQLSFREDCWVQIKDARGQILLRSLMRAGSTREVQGVAPLQVRLGNAPAVSLQVDGQPYPLQAQIGNRIVASLRIPPA